MPIIDKIVAAANGEKDPHFWNSAGKVAELELSGSYPKFCGWLVNFFPYI